MNNFPLPSVAPLSHLRVIRVTGADAADFLHGQLTQDITGLPPGQARLAGYCTPKGRLLGTLVIWRDPQQTQDLLALMPADIAEALVKRLTMFVLRAKAKLTITPLSVLGVTLVAGTAGATPPETESSDQIVPPNDTAPWAVLQTSQGTWVSAPRRDADIQRWWLITDQEPASPNSDANALQAAWQAQDIAAGLPWIHVATQDLFIPQTLNLDLIEGVNFTKGCYPGQEIVARSHYRGTVKRRMAYGIANESQTASPLQGADIFDAARPESPSGRVINAALRGQQTHLLLEIHLADLATADYRLGTPDGAQISIQPLPYHIDSVEAG